MTTDEKARNAADLFEQAVKNYEQALKTGLKLQEESARMWTGLLSQNTAPQEWQRRMKAVADELVPQTQKGLDEGVKLVEQTSRTSIDLLKKAVAAAQASSVQEGQAKFLGLWEASLNALRDSALAASQAGGRALDLWMEVVRKCTSAAPAAAPKG
jgi:hypothetical protein